MHTTKEVVCIMDYGLTKFCALLESAVKTTLFLETKQFKPLSGAFNVQS